MHNLDHEIPNGSKLYFSKSAKIKRELENFSADIFLKHEFNEIVTPYFSYHQHLSVKKDQILSVKDLENNELSLRADSTIDVSRIVLKRLKDENLKRIFYIQPVFKYPSNEIYQIGAELLGSRNLSTCLDIASEIFDKFDVKTKLQISNIEIPHIVCKLLNLPLTIFEKGDINALLKLNLEWVNALLGLSDWSDLGRVKKIVPSELIAPLERIENLAVNRKNVCIMALYYSKMRYYDKLFFRFVSDNSILCSGGDYEIDGLESSGFAVMSDAVIERILEKREYR
ncbi:MAG: ATP phosphoribosyltransferase regulatory subunit [Campylobacter sp.]|nr:ATP phosphoribosyltransferase regulatory subunit [Campylobacter sp.]